MSEVEVTFVDDATGQTFGVTRLSASNLPESFELDTTLHLGNVNWSVVSAQPTTRSEFAKSKSLTLRLHRIERIDPSSILFCLPSICDFIPAVGDQPLTGREFVLAEDDWRQFELVSNELAADVDAEIAKIRIIHDTAAAQVGWRKLHVRSRPELPIICDLALAELAIALKVSPQSSGVTYDGAISRIRDGCSFTMDVGLSVFGVAPNGKVQVIGIAQYCNSSPAPESLDRLAKLANKLNLDLVYWCRCARVRPDDPLFVQLLRNDVA